MQVFLVFGGFWIIVNFLVSVSCKVLNCELFNFRFFVVGQEVGFNIEINSLVWLFRNCNFKEEFRVGVIISYVLIVGLC